jgi:hypothetical protein
LSSILEYGYIFDVPDDVKSQRLDDMNVEQDMKVIPVVRIPFSKPRQYNNIGGKAMTKIFRYHILPYTTVLINAIAILVILLTFFT